MVPATQTPARAGFRTPLAEKIFLDRYALKSMDKEAIRVGDPLGVAVRLRAAHARSWIPTM